MTRRWNVFSGVLVGIGLVFLGSPIFLNWWLHGDYDRYVRIISGPFPLSHLGSGIVQLWLSAGLFMLGIFVTLVGVVMYTGKKRSDRT